MELSEELSVELVMRDETHVSAGDVLLQRLLSIDRKTRLSIA